MRYGSNFIFFPNDYTVIASIFIQNTIFGPVTLDDTFIIICYHIFIIFIIIIIVFIIIIYF